MSEPRVSVLLPVYNAAATLDEALDSLRTQSLEAIEIVAVDDGSTDGSGHKLRVWARRDARLRVLRMEHAGLIRALNRGLEACRAPLVARMDADDVAHPERLAAQADLLQACQDVSVAGCLVDAFPSDQVGEGFRIYLEWLNALRQHEDIAREIFIESPIVHPSAMVRRDELLGLGGYQDRGWPEDYDLWLRYFVAGRRFQKVERVLLSWREHERRMTHVDSRYAVENFLRAKAWYLARGPLQDRDALYVWGAGRTGRRLSKHLIRAGWRPAAFVDIAASRIGGTLRQVPIVGPEALPAAWQRHERPLLLTAVASRGARDLIRTHLGNLGWHEGEEYLCAA